MRVQSVTARALAAALVAAALVAPLQVQAQRKEVKIGVIYDYTGPFAAGGSQAAAVGSTISGGRSSGAPGAPMRPIVRSSRARS